MKKEVRICKMYIHKRQRKQKGQSGMDHPERHASLTNTKNTHTTQHTTEN